ncbi:unnamed protein product [Symbiodinium natans]|uniref:RanBP2-type domain-containing protein n=1 Tax=Symbiodinium natans TaxID=878477 RepID=A0A812RKP6_9DINO|nr:unnamed protein product [Symbiodinium natans]
MAGESGALPWQCGICTLLNPPGAARCNACDNPRETTAAPAPVLRLDATPQPAPAVKAPASVPAPVMKPSAASAGLSVSERKAREEEMAAKRQKKEEEKQRILAQAEADRRARMEAPTPAPEAPAPSQPRPAPATRKVRLQMLCPQWGRNIVFTCFESNNTLGDLRRALREDLVRGVAGTGDGRLQDPEAAEAQVPEEAAIVLAEQVPPRRKFVSSEDMQMTLADASLCPSGTLLVDAAPIKIAVPPPLVPEPVEPAEDDPQPAQVDDDQQVSGGEPSEPGSDDDDGHDDSGDDDDDDGQYPPGAPFFGKGFGKGRGRGTGSGTFGAGFGRGNMGGGFGAQWRFGPTGPGPLMPDDEGGQVLGSTGTATTFPAGPGQTTGTASPEEQRAAREARLAALERRAGPATQGAPETKPAEPSASGASMPAHESGRIKGQLGTGASKAARAKEREAILQQMEEDRQRFEERYVAPSAVAAQSETKAEASGACRQVRLQIRCASSGRVVTGTSFGPDDTLLSVRDFAAKELCLLLGEGTDGPEMSLAFPPRTSFTSEEQLSSSLAQLGLTPSATLLIKGISAMPAAPAEDAEGGAAAPEVPSAPTSASCPRGHAMVLVATSEDAWCDKCSEALPPGEQVYNCSECDYFECKSCRARGA